ncbi:MAG: hypothetical protein K5770_01340 [Lachnospiraceae bacterium]|nr:hypothetical protein [Lachnospiraceae bacterium]
MSSSRILRISGNDPDHGEEAGGSSGKTEFRESREPKFIRLGAFIIPFVLGVLFRFYDASLMALGIILTYGVVKRRDRFLNPDTGFYNTDFLKYLGTYRDKKNYSGECVIALSAPSDPEGLARILHEMGPQNGLVIDKGDGEFLLFAEDLRESAARMAQRTFKEAAGMWEPPFSVETSVVKRREDETASAFAKKLL